MLEHPDWGQQENEEDTHKEKLGLDQAVVLHTFNPSTWEAETGGSLWDWGQPGLQSGFQERLQSYRETLSYSNPVQNKHTEAYIHYKLHDLLAQAYY